MTRDGKRGQLPIGPLVGGNWDGMAGFDSLIKSLPQTPELSALLSDYKVRQLGAGNDWNYNGNGTLGGMSVKSEAAKANQWRAWHQ